jgi:hypothetical protein
MHIKNIQLEAILVILAFKSFYFVRRMRVTVSEAPGYLANFPKYPAQFVEMQKFL